MTLPTRTLKDYARQAAAKSRGIELGVFDDIADAVAIAVLRHVWTLAKWDQNIGSVVSTPLIIAAIRELDAPPAAASIHPGPAEKQAEFDAPAQETTCWRCQLPYLDGRVCSGSNFTLMCAVKDAPGAQENGVTTAPNPRGADTGKGLPPSPEVQPSYQCEDRLGIDGKTYRCDSVEGHEGSHSHGPTIRWQTPAPGAQERKEEKDHGAGLIHPVASPSDGTEPRLTEPEFDGDYPSEETLVTIKRWPFDDIDNGLDFVAKAWHWPDFGVSHDLRLAEAEVCYAEPGRRYLRLATGGWSGNEDIIAAMRENHGFWACWQLSGRGGLHIYEYFKETDGNPASTQSSGINRGSAAQKASSHSRPSLTEET